MAESHGTQDGDPEKFVNLAIDLVKREGCAESREIPLALPSGPDAYARVKQRLELE
ncbi:hypothetical protein B0A55_12744 [Friedmanniomyces simplex]|uniref:Uncharacterized protein n=1 Tax=Friedmanniomyces simplex TaxID=329884 RepID=A0A4U0VMW5_9PEZI|nr:hypothetical protein B0A55_12744 [Friedmanniomyces simplex]